MPFAHDAAPFHVSNSSLAATTRVAGWSITETAAGPSLVPADPRVLGDRDYRPRSSDARWVYAIPYAAIPESVTIAEHGVWGCAGSWFSNDHVDQFSLPGEGQPMTSIALNASGGNARVAGAKRANIAVYTDVEPAATGGPSLRIQARSESGPLWSITFDPSMSNVALGPKGLAISRDGSRVAVTLNGRDPESNAPISQLAIINGTTGALIGTWPAEGTVVAVDLTDAGDLCLATVGRNSHVIETASMTRVFTATGNGTGGRSVISGNGAVLVTPGFDFRIWRRTSATTWVRTTTFTQPGLWFGWGASVSRDGTTAGVIAQKASAAYLETYAFTFDSLSGAVVGSATTVGSGALQDGAAGSVLSDDGSVFAVATWGTLFNDHPEVRVFSRGGSPLGSVDTIGSPMGLDISPDGRLLIIGAKRTHANVVGAGGDVLLYEVPGITPCPCSADFDGSEGTPDISDIEVFFSGWLSGMPLADTDCSGGTPDGNDLAQFFESWLNGGC